MITETFGTIGLDDLAGEAGLLERMDAKYVVPLDVLAALVDALHETHRLLCVDGRTRFSYRSTYFDSPDLASFREHVQGRRRRFKCRARLYVDTGVHAFEVKLKGPRGRTIKRRLACDPLGDGLLGDPARGFLHRCLREEYGRLLEAPLAPALIVEYERTTFAAPERRERVTCDLGLRFRAPGGATGRIREGFAVVESKSLHGAGTADRVLRGLGARPVSECSKYCLGVGLTRPSARANRLKPLLRSRFE